MELNQMYDTALQSFYSMKGFGLDAETIRKNTNLDKDQFRLALNKLEQDDFVKITKTKSGDYVQITPKGEIFYNSNSYHDQFQDEKENKKKIVFKDNFDFAKGIIEVIIAIITVSLAIWTFVLDKKINSNENKIQRLENSLDSLKMK